MAVPAPHAHRDTLLHHTRQRLTRLEIEVHRLRAELARLEALGEDEAAERLARQLRVEERRLALEGVGRGALVADRAIPPQGAPDRQHDDASEAPLSGAIPTPVGARKAVGKSTRRARRKAPRIRAVPAWVVSIAAHGALLGLFGIVGFATLQDKPNFLLANSYDGPKVLEDLAEIPLKTPDETPIDLQEIIEAPQLMQPAEFASELQAPWAPAPLGSEPLALGIQDAMLTDIEGMMTGDAGGAAHSGGGRGERGGGAPRGAQFFGAESRGESVVYVVDNSGSMVDGRMETTLMELARSVALLDAEQRFHVLFYSDQVYPMFFPEPLLELAPATRENRARLERWLTTVRMCRGGALREAMDLAASLRPDVVYLLTDGDYLLVRREGRLSKSSTLQRLTDPDEWPLVIHTLGMTVRDVEDAQALAMVARAHGGVFRHVQVSPVAARMSRERPIPYHKERGTVWGSKVR